MKRGEHHRRPIALAGESIAVQPPRPELFAALRKNSAPPPIQWEICDSTAFQATAVIPGPPLGELGLVHCGTSYCGGLISIRKIDFRHSVLLRGGAVKFTTGNAHHDPVSNRAFLRRMRDDDVCER